MSLKQPTSMTAPGNYCESNDTVTYEIKSSWCDGVHTMYTLIVTEQRMTLAWPFSKYPHIVDMRTATTRATLLNYVNQHYPNAKEV